MIKFALVGNPNSGKTTLFNSLTGSTARVGNWPGVTVDRKEGVYKKLAEPIVVVDLPGIYSLSPYTSEEVISRNFIIDNKPDCIINIIDATNLERNLYLTTQIMEIDVPVVIALNMIDIVNKNGDKIDIESLGKKIGIPIVAISALKGIGLKELMGKAYETSKIKRQGKTILQETVLEELIEDVKIELEAKKIGNALFHAIKLIELDELELKMHANMIEAIQDLKGSYKNDILGADIEALVADSRYKYITNNYTSSLIKQKNDELYANMSDKIDKVLTHKIFSIPLIFVVFFVIFHLTFSENFLFLGGVINIEGITLNGTAFEGVFASSGISSPGVILQNLIVVLTDSATLCIRDLLASSPTWISGLICDGILGGLSAVLSFIPQILLLLLLFSILEDSGYMSRLAFILDKIFRKFGLSGRAFLPMIMGFGCSVPAIVNTRTLSNENEKIATIRVIPFFSCGAKLPILMAISGAIVIQFGVGNADAITYLMYLLGIATAMISLIIMRATTIKADAPPFIMELPSYHAPQFKSLMIHLWDKAKHFIKKAFTIILASTIIIWFVSHFNFSFMYLEDTEISSSILANIGQLIQPLFTPLGFGSQLGSWGWVFVVAAITGLIAKENVIATFGTLAACIVAGFDGSVQGVDAVVTLIGATGITVAGLLAFIAFNMTTIPCLAAVATARAELISKSKFNWTLVFWISTSYIVGTMIYVIGSWWWTSFVFIILAFLIIVIIAKHNKKLNKRSTKCNQ